MTAVDVVSLVRVVLGVWAIAAVVVPTTVLPAALILAIARRRSPQPLLATDEIDVHIVRPLCGREEDAERKNESLLRQTHERLRVSFVAANPGDPGLVVAREMCRGAGRGKCIVAEHPCAVGKARNMIAGWRAADAQWTGYCDADIELAPRDVTSALEAALERGAAGVFAPCLFDDSGFSGRLAMHVATIDKLVLAEAGALLGIVPYMEAGFMVLSRAAVEDVGGIEIVNDAVADDLRIARALREKGYRLAVSSAPVVHRGAPETAREWASRYLRWAVCRRAEAPALPLIVLSLHPILVPTAVAVTLHDLPLVALAAVGALARTIYGWAAARILLAPMNVRPTAAAMAMRPLAEILDAGFLVAASLTRSLCWRGTRYRVHARGRLSRLTDG